MGELLSLTGGGTAAQQREKEHQQNSAKQPQPQHQHRRSPPPPRAQHTQHHFPEPHAPPTIAGADSHGHGDATKKADASAPPPKRRKLNLRHSAPRPPTQTTLDKFAFAAAQPQPPSKISVDEPHGQLVETINGVRTALDVGEDELSLSSPKPQRMPRRATRSPVPAPASVTANASNDAPGAQKEVKKEEKRTLRSQDEGPRLKSDLATYFPNYEDVMFDAPRDEEFLTVDTALYVTDDAKQDDAVKSSQKRKKEKSSSSSSNAASTSASNGQYNGCQSVDLDFASKTISDHPADPLSDAHFDKSHRRAERKEKQLRNIERERAMHEKVQLDRILDGLQGHDWLRVLGITGITDGEAKRYEPKRDYFIAEVQGLVDKFKQWKEQEKEARLRKEEAAAARAEEEGGTSLEGSVEPPTSSDLNASASRQLQQETVNAVRSSMTLKLKGKSTATPTPTSQPGSSSTPVRRLTLHPPARPQPVSPDRPFTSFYSKSHLRDAALGKVRNHGRLALAFGQQVPELEEREFELPDEYLTEDALRANARERRRRKRQNLIDANEKAGV